MCHPHPSRLIGLHLVGVVALILAAYSYAAERPNIIIILADDMGYGDVGCQNPDSKIPTPHLDQLASQGMRFTDAHSPSAVCTPTRYGLLTGTYAWRTALKSSVLWPWDGPLIDEKTITLPGMLSDAGYSTACIGKWHLGWDWATTDGSKINDVIPLGKWDAKVRDPWGEKIDFTKTIAGGPTARGFGYYFGDDVPNFAPYCFIENDRVLAVPESRKPDDMFGTAGPMVEGWDLTAVLPALARKAVEYIKAAPGIGKSEAHRYGDFVNEVDWLVGEVMAALEATGQARNTLLIFTSDNGSPGRDGDNMAGKPNSVRAYGHNPSHIYRGIKTDAWEGGHRVPLIVRWPGKVTPGVSDEVVCLTDFMATCAEITGAPLADDAARDSYNLLPLFRGKKANTPLREATVHHSYDGAFAIRQGDWKLIDGPGSGGWLDKGTKDDPQVQLYNLANDVGETKNLQAEHPEMVVRLETLLERYKAEGRSVARAAD